MNDVQLTTTQLKFDASEVLQTKNVRFSLRVDNIAQESMETFALTLELSNTDQFGAGVNIRDRLEGVILDSDGKFNK